MKIRSGFVSNSSSSSFVVRRYADDTALIDLILAFRETPLIEYLDEMDEWEREWALGKGKPYVTGTTNPDYWSFNLRDADGVVQLDAFTAMDNGYFDAYMKKVGIDDSLLDWQERGGG